MSAAATSFATAACSACRCRFWAASPRPPASVACRRSPAPRARRAPPSASPAACRRRHRPGHHRGRRRPAGHAAGCRVPLRRRPDLVLKPALAASWKPNDNGSVWTFKLRKGVKYPRARPEGRRRGGQHRPPCRPGKLVQRAVGVHRHPVEGRHQEGRRLDGGIPPRRAERQLPLHAVVGQLQRRHHPGELQGRLREELRRHRAVQGREVHAESRRILRPQRELLGREGPARSHGIHLLHRCAADDPGPAGRPGRHHRPDAGPGRRRPAQRSERRHHQPEVLSASATAPALRRRSVEGRARAPRHRAQHGSRQAGRRPDEGSRRGGQ